MIGILPLLLVALPFGVAAALALIKSWRIGTLVNAGSATVLFALSCALPWDLPSHLLRLTTFIAMTTSWYGRRDIGTALAARTLGRRRAQIYHIAYQALIGSINLALLAPRLELEWVALVIAMASAVAIVGTTAPTSRLALLLGTALTLALLGTPLIERAPAPATLFLLLGYGGVAGLAPLHAWLVDAAEGAPAPGGLVLSVLMANAPLLCFMRLQTAIAPALLTTLGLVSLFCGATLLLTRRDPRHAVAYGGVAQLGLIECGIGLGIAATPRLIAMLALARAAVLQCDEDGPTRQAAVSVLALLPLFAFYLTAGAAAAWSGWLLAPLGLGVLLTSYGLLRALPAKSAAPPDVRMLLPIWLQLAMVLGVAVLG